MVHVSCSYHMSSNDGGSGQAKTVCLFQKSIENISGLKPSVAKNPVGLRSHFQCFMFRIFLWIPELRGACDLIRAAYTWSNSSPGCKNPMARNQLNYCPLLSHLFHSRTKCKNEFHHYAVQYISIKGKSMIIKIVHYMPDIYLCLFHISYNYASITSFSNIRITRRVVLYDAV